MLPAVPGLSARGITTQWLDRSADHPLLTMLRDTKRIQADEAVSLRVQRILGDQVLGHWDDPSVRELYVNSDGHVWVLRSVAGRQPTGLILDEVSIQKFLGVIAAYRGEILNPEKPVLRAAMPEPRFLGARLQGYVPPRAPGPGFTLRKHLEEVPPLARYLERGALSFEQFDFLLEAVDRRLNILIAGATASGKTTFLCSLLSEIVRRWPSHRLLIVEDTPEIRCDAEDVERYWPLPGAEIDQALNRELMRLTPDRVIWSEYADERARYCADVWVSGHEGGLATMHAGSVEGALDRTNELMLNGRVGSYMSLVARAVNVVVVLERGPVGGRVKDLALVDGLDSRGRFKIHRPRAGAHFGRLV